MKEQLTLGQLIFLLSRCDPEAEVYYDFGGFTPESIDSYRGYYDHLALSYDAGPPRMKCGDLLSLCRGAVGEVFTGYKGGDYLMGNSTPIWVANVGQCHDTALVGVIDRGWRVILETGFQDS